MLMISTVKSMYYNPGLSSCVWFVTENLYGKGYLFEWTCGPKNSHQSISHMQVFAAAAALAV